MNLTETRILQELNSAFINIPFNQLLGLKLDELSTDHVIMSFNMKNELVGNFMYGILHGGVISSVLDMAGGMVVMASAIHKHPNSTMADLAEIMGKCSTIDLHINYLTPGKGDRFIAKASIIKRGNLISFTKMELLNQQEMLIATGNGTYLLK